jgi:hypothetical protein
MPSAISRMDMVLKKLVTAMLKHQKTEAAPGELVLQPQLEAVEMAPAEAAEAAVVEAAAVEAPTLKRREVWNLL